MPAEGDDFERQQEYLDAVHNENSKLEEEIARLQAEGEAAQTLTKGAPPSSLETKKLGSQLGGGSRIKVIDFGALDHAETAGIDNGSRYRPAQCGRRTQLGGFFMS